MPATTSSHPRAVASSTAPREQVSRDQLERYRPGSSSFFASPGGEALLGEGVAAVLPAWATDESRADRVAALLDDARRSGHPAPLAIGALPFDRDLPARMVVPAHVRRGPTAALSTQAGPAEHRGAPEQMQLTPVTAHAAFVESVEQAVDQLRAGTLRKVVLSRALELTAAAPIDVSGLLRRLVHSEPSAYSFAIDLPRAVGRARDGYPARPTRTLIGASPELLLRRRGRAVSSHPLAGSAPRSVNPAEDRRRGAALRGSAKDLGEHAIVVEAIGDALAPLCSSLTLPRAPELVRTSTMWHLGTPIAGTLRTDQSALHVALALHPTPAICGVPVSTARTVIAELEPYEREFYTGLVGWMDAAGDGDWAVTIRCAQVEDQRVRLYAGAGIMAESDPRCELAETAAKARTFLRAMGIDTEPEFAA